MWGVGCGVWGVGCGVWGVGWGVWGVGCGVPQWLFKRPSCVTTYAIFRFKKAILTSGELLQYFIKYVAEPAVFRSPRSSLSL